jgi:hypothetical protein
MSHFGIYTNFNKGSIIYLLITINYTKPSPTNTLYVC